MKLNRNHLLKAKIFKLDEYQTFGVMKMHEAKSDLSIINSFYEKFWFTIKSRQKCYFLIFAFSFFQILIVHLKCTAVHYANLNSGSKTIRF